MASLSHNIFGRGLFSLLLVLTTILMVSPMSAYGSTFNTTGAKRLARTRLYSDLESSLILKNKFVPLSLDGPVEVDIFINLYKVGLKNLGHKIFPTPYTSSLWVFLFRARRQEMELVFLVKL